MHLPCSPRIALFALCSLAPVGRAQLIEAELVPDQGAGYDWFGYSVAVDAALAPDAPIERLLVGAPLTDRAFLFEKIAGEWTQADELVPPSPAPFAYGTSTLALSGEYAAISSGGDGVPVDGDVSVSIFREVAGQWSYQTSIESPSSSSSSQFGRRFAWAGDQLLIAAPSNSDVGPFRGAVHVFEPSGTNWIETATLRPPAGTAYTDFGVDLAVSGTTAAVSTLGTSDFSSVPGGSVHLFEQSSGAWIPNVILTTPQPAPFGSLDYFGLAIDLFEERLVVWESVDGNPQIHGNRLQFFDRSAGAWLPSGSIVPGPEENGFSDTWWGLYELTTRGDRLSYYSEFVFSSACAGGSLLLHRTEDGVAWAGDGNVAFFANACDPARGHLLRENLAAFAYYSESGAYRLALIDLSTHPNLLTAQRGSLSLASPESLWLRTFTEDYAGEFGLVLGSVTGTAPSVPLGPGLELPLVVDSYTLATLNSSPSSMPLAGGVEVLKSWGQAAVFSLPAGSPSAWAGLEIHHAAVILDQTTGAVLEISEPVTFELIP